MIEEGAHRSALHHLVFANLVGISPEEKVITEQQFETDVMALLRISFSGPNDPGLVQRLNKLKSTFQAVDDAALAVKLYDRLSTADSKDALANAFHERLATSTRHDLLAILTAVKGANPKPVPRSEEYKLVDEDAKTVRTIAHSDPEYQEAVCQS